MRNPLSPLRPVALAEAVSWLVLLGVAMPLKYALDMPMAVRVAGMVHGLLFLVLLWLLVRARYEAAWPMRRIWLVFAAALVPFWPFVLDCRVRQWVAEAQRA